MASVSVRTPTHGEGTVSSPNELNIYFAGKMIWQGLGTTQPPPFGSGTAGIVLPDRLGTNRAGGARFYPYGDEITSTSNDREKFATYTRDSYTGLDYANQRYFASTYGRFNTADPYAGSAGAGDPSSWNRYSYTKGDPVNRMDRSGLVASLTCGSGGYQSDEDGVEQPCEDWVPDECYIIDGVVSPGVEVVRN